MNKDIERSAEKSAYLTDFHILKFKKKNQKSLFVLLLDFDSNFKSGERSVQLYQSRIIPLFSINYSNGTMPPLYSNEFNDRQEELTNLSSLAFFNKGNHETWSFGPYGQVRATYPIEGTGLFSYGFAHLVKRCKLLINNHNLTQDRQVSLSEVDTRLKNELRSRNDFYIRAGFTLVDDQNNINPNLKSGNGVALFSDLSIKALENENILTVPDPFPTGSIFTIDKNTLLTAKITFREIFKHIDKEFIGKFGQYEKLKTSLEYHQTLQNLATAEMDATKRPFNLSKIFPNIGLHGIAYRKFLKHSLIVKNNAEEIAKLQLSTTC
jgi:hypothetical protein